jgi:hypothetical protein
MKKANKQKLISNEVLVQKAKLLNTAGKPSKHIREVLELSLDEMNIIRAYLIGRKQWTYNGAWAKRNTMHTKSIKTIKTTKPNKSTSVKSVVVKESRRPKAIEVLHINFKGINVEIQKSSNIVVTENTIYVK